MWTFGARVQSASDRTETAEITLVYTGDRTRRDNSTKTQQGIRMTVCVTVNHPSKRWRKRYVYSSPTRGEQTTHATATDMLRGRLHNAQSNAEEQTPLSKWMSKGCHGEVAKIAELSLFLQCCHAVKTGRRVDKMLIGLES